MRQTSVLQILSKLVWLNSQQLDCADCMAGNSITVYRTSRSEGATTEGAAADAWNHQLMATGGQHQRLERSSRGEVTSVLDNTTRHRYAEFNVRSKTGGQSM